MAGRGRGGRGGYNMRFMPYAGGGGGKASVRVEPAQGAADAPRGPQFAPELLPFWWAGTLCS